jgi:hypothetical protein
MNAKAHAIRSEVLALPVVERAELIFDLLDSLDGRPTESDQAELDSVRFHPFATVDSGCSRVR